MMLRPGTFLQDRYEIIEQIGSGGMSVVYKAMCHKLNRLVAIKVLKEEFCSDSNFVAKFKMEAQAAARLSHPNIVSVYDVIDEGQLHYIVMELIEGITLKSYIAKKGRLEIKESIGIAIQVAQGMEAAHEQHIIHRDIKPQNMLISRDGKVKVTDFGIARAVSSQTLTSAAMGSVHYISPEQARGGYSDERSDIYSLGITMYEMVTGRVPFDGENTVSIALAHLEDVMVPPSIYNPEIPPSLEQIILKCTEKKPEYRYSSAAEVIGDLRAALIHPDGDFVKPGRENKDIGGETLVISDGDLARIKGRNRGDMDPSRQPARESGEPLARRQPAEGTERTSGKAVSGTRRGEAEEVSPQIERILAGAGIVAAVIIVAVLIVVVSRLGGVFQSGTGLLGGNSTQPQAQSDASQELSLPDTEVYMPSVQHLTEDAAKALLAERSLTMKPTYDYFDDVEKGIVVSQDPAPGAVVLKGDSVAVVVSNGSDKLDLEEMGIGSLDGDTAKKFLESRSLTVKVVEEESDTVEKGQVIRFDPAKASEGETVTLYVSSGPHVDLVEVPNLEHKTESEAIALLTEAGLSPGDTSSANSDTVEKGSVISQGTAAGAQVEPGTRISYVISSGPQVVTQRRVAAINETYDLSSLVGPGAGSASVTVMIRLRQGTDDSPLYKVLMPATTIQGDLLLPVNYTSIESIDGSEKGELEIVDVDSGEIIKSYPLTFLPMS